MSELILIPRRASGLHITEGWASLEIHPVCNSRGVNSTAFVYLWSWYTVRALFTPSLTIERSDRSKKSKKSKLNSQFIHFQNSTILKRNFREYAEQLFALSTRMCLKIWWWSVTTSRYSVLDLLSPPSYFKKAPVTVFNFEYIYKISWKIRCESTFYNVITKGSHRIYTVTADFFKIVQ